MFLKLLFHSLAGQLRDHTQEDPEAVSAGTERFVDGAKEAGAHGEPGEHAKSQEAGGKNQEIPGSQTEPDGPPVHAFPSSRNVYPTPRTV